MSVVDSFLEGRRRLEVGLGEDFWMRVRRAWCLVVRLRVLGRVLLLWVRWVWGEGAVGGRGACWLLDLGVVERVRGACHCWSV